MSTSKLLARASAVAFFASILTACGGGGGGGGSDGGNIAPGGNAGGNTDVVALTVDNSKQLTFTSTLIASVADAAVRQAPDSVRNTMSMVAEEGTINETLGCDEGTDHVKGSANGDNTGDVTLTYSDCVDQQGGVRYNGALHMTVHAADANGRPTSFDYQYDNYRYESVSAGIGYRYSGKFSVRPEGNRTRLTIDLTITDLRSRVSYSAVGYSALYSHSPSSSYPFYYPVEAQRGGYISHSTFGKVGVGIDADNSEVSYLEGANRSRLRVNSGSVMIPLRLALDADGDGKFERFARIPEDHLGSVISGNTAPIINVADPQLPPGPQQVTVSLDDVLDGDFDFLKYSVELQQGPVSDIQLALNDDRSFGFLATLTGNYVVLLTVDDGRGGTTSKAISIHVPQAAPDLGSIPASATLNAGDTLGNFSAQPANPEAGPFTYRLVSAPAGMTIDGNGLLHWQAPAGFFARTTAQAKIAVSNAEQSSIATVRFTVNDAQKAVPLVRSGLRMPTANKGAFILDLDGDNQRELLLTNHVNLVYTVKYDGSNYVQDWVYPYAIEDAAIKFIQPFDADHDGKYEIAVVTGSNIHIINETRDGIARSTSLYGGINGIATGDIDGDGSEELVVLSSSNSYGQGIVLDATTLQEKWRTPFLELGHDLAIGNVDGDAALELIFAGGYVFDGATHASQWTGSAQVFGTQILVGDIDGNGVAEIIGKQYDDPPAVFSAVSYTKFYVTGAPGLTIMGNIALAQLDGDSALEIVVGDTLQQTVTAYDATASAATVKWTTSFFSNPAISFADGDIDNDGTTDLLWTSNSHFAVLDTGTHSIKFQNNNGNRILGGFSGGQLLPKAGANTQLLFAESNSVHFVAMDSVTGELSLGTAAVGSWREKTDFCVADYDQDGTSEILFSARQNSAGALQAMDFFTSTQEWLQFLGASTFSPSPSAACGDFNRDGHMDIATHEAGSLEIHDAFDQSTIASISLPSMEPGPLISKDLSGDSSPELLSAHDGAILELLRKDGSTYVSQATYIFHAGAGDCIDTPSTGCTPLASGTYTINNVAALDVDGDSIPEIVLTAVDTNALLSNIGSVGSYLVVLDRNLSERSRFVVPGLIHALAPEQSAAGKAMVAVTFSEQDPIEFLTWVNRRVGEVSLTSGNWIWFSSPLLGDASQSSLHYDSANTRLVFGTDDAMYMTR
jgi:hypothetical protein